MGLARTLRGYFGYYKKGSLKILRRKPSILGGNVIMVSTYNDKYGTGYWVAHERPEHGWALDDLLGFDSDLEAATADYEGRE